MRELRSANEWNVLGKPAGRETYSQSLDRRRIRVHVSYPPGSRLTL